MTGTVRGTFKPVRSFVHAGARPGGAGYRRPFVYGVLRLTLRRGEGSLVGHSVRKVALFIRSATAPATCDVLRLLLGPRDLDLLGRKVHLDRVVLNIVAQADAGSGVRNALCAVTPLVPGSGNLMSQLRVANIVNRLPYNLRIV